MISMKENDQKLDGVLANRRQGQEGNYPPRWSFQDCIMYEYYEVVMASELMHHKQQYREMTVDQKDWHTEKFIEYHDYHDRLRKQKPKFKHAGYELGAREFTLTYSPKWEGYDDATARQKMILAITRLLNYYNNEIVRFIAIGEVGQNGQSHIHGFYELKGGLKITDKNFKRAYSPWNPQKKIGKGFEGGHHQTVRCESDFIGYINKDVASSWFHKIISQPYNINNEDPVQETSSSSCDEEDED